MTITGEKKGEKTVLTFEGDVTALEEQSLMKAVQSYGNDCATIIMDFKRVLYIDTPGISLLLGIATEMIRKKGKLYIVNLTPHYRRIFTMIDPTQLITISKSSEEALAAQD